MSSEPEQDSPATAVSKVLKRYPPNIIKTSFEKSKHAVAVYDTLGIPEAARGPRVPPALSNGSAPSGSGTQAPAASKKGKGKGTGPPKEDTSDPDIRKTAVHSASTNPLSPQAFFQSQQPYRPATPLIPALLSTVIVKKTRTTLSVPEARVEEENKAIGRALAGLAGPVDNLQRVQRQWCDATIAEFGAFTPTDAITGLFASYTTTLQQKGNDTILFIDGAINSVTATKNATSALQLAAHIVQAIIDIDIIVEWDKQEQTAVTLAYAQLCQLRKNLCVNLQGQTLVKALEKDHGPVFFPFKSELSKEMTARRKLLEMYNQLGPLILVDLFFTTNRLYADHLSKTYVKLTKLLFDTGDGLPRAGEEASRTTVVHRYPVTARAVVGIARGLHVQLGQFVADFMRRRVCEVKKQRSL
ncbi:hypothetical protein C8F01DRAFT_1117397 [Mycena amicta]|nr:hypothetical protein C8F01DRAFT_1117397 [Mycena amicta]